MRVAHTQPPGVPGATGPRRRVREEARDALVLMLFSAATSIGCALLLLLTRLAGR